MSCIGFFVETYEDFENLLHRAVEHGERIETGSGAYARWSAGAERV